jgi:hypothetical protein
MSHAKDMVRLGVRPRKGLNEDCSIVTRLAEAEPSQCPPEHLPVFGLKITVFQTAHTPAPAHADLGYDFPQPD